MKNFIKCALGVLFMAVPLWAHAEEAPYGVSALAIPQHIMKIEFSAEDSRFQLKANGGHYVLSEYAEPVAACGPLGRIEAMASALDFHQDWHGLAQQSTVNVGVDWSWCAPKSHNQAQDMNMPVKGVVQVCLRVITATGRITTTPAPLAVCGAFAAEWQGSVNWSPKTETELVWLDFGKKKLKKADPKNSDAIIVTNQEGVRYHMTWPQREASHCKPYRDFVSSSRLFV